MPNDNLDDEKKKTEEEKSIEDDVKKTLDELKSKGMNLSDEELAEFEKILTRLARKERESAFKKLFKSGLEYLLRFGILFLVCTISMGFFYYFLVLENIMMVLLVSLTVSFALLAIEMLFDFIITKNARHPFTLYMLFIIVLVGFSVAFNYFDFKIFELASIWIAYYIAVLSIYLIINYIILKQTVKRRIK